MQIPTSGSNAHNLRAEFKTPPLQGPLAKAANPGAQGDKSFLGVFAKVPGADVPTPDQSAPTLAAQDEPETPPASDTQENPFGDAESDVTDATGDDITSDLPAFQVSEVPASSAADETAEIGGGGNDVDPVFDKDVTSLSSQSPTALARPENPGHPADLLSETAGSNSEEQSNQPEIDSSIHPQTDTASRVGPGSPAPGIANHATVVKSPDHAGTSTQTVPGLNAAGSAGSGALQASTARDSPIAVEKNETPALAEKSLPPASRAYLSLNVLRDAGNLPAPAVHPGHARSPRAPVEVAGGTGSETVKMAPSAQASAAAPTPQAVAGLVPFMTKPQEGERMTFSTDTAVLSEVRSFTDPFSASKPSMDQLLQQPQIPRHLAVQVAGAVQRAGAEQPISLLLNPAELGLVKISMTTSDAGVSVMVLADRPETLDLMRRHIDILAQEFLDIGYGSAEFSFGQGAPENQGESHQGGPDLQFAIATPTDNEPQLSMSNIAMDRIDIRL